MSNNKYIYINARFLTQKTTGVQRYAIEVSKQLHTMYPNKFIWVSPKNIYQEKIAKLLAVQIIGKYTGYLWEQYELPKFLKAEGSPLLLNLCNMAPIWYLNKITTIHDMAFFANPKWFSKKFALSYKFIIPKIINTSKLIFTVSNFSKNEIIKYSGISPIKIKVIPNGVSSHFTPNLDQKENFILTVGSLDSRKNLIYLIEAFKLIPSKNIKLVIIGKKNKIFANETLFNLINNDERIIFTGYLTDEQLLQFYQKAGVFVYPSIYEGFGIPPLEAMACSTPTLVSDIEVFKEVLGDATSYFNTKEDLVQKIDILLTNSQLSKKKVELGMTLVKNYKWSASASKIYEVLIRL